MLLLSGAEKWWKMCTMLDFCGYSRQLLTVSHFGDMANFVLLIHRLFVWSIFRIFQHSEDKAEIHMEKRKQKTKQIV